MVRFITQVLKLPLAVVAKYRPEHRVIRTLSAEGLEASTADGDGECERGRHGPL